MQAEAEVVLDMRGISKSFPGVKALDNVQLSLKKGSVMALMGENGAGKSTLMKILFGMYSRDSGTITLDGQDVQFDSALDALENGVTMIHQELAPILHRSVAENIWLGREPLKGPLKLIDHDKMWTDTQTLLRSLDLEMDPKKRMCELTVAQMQMVEIAKAISYNARIIIMDEPTSSLTDKEVKHLFEIIRRLKGEGVSIVYISHKMDEIFQICDEITVFRDGQYISCVYSRETNQSELINMMVGRELKDMFVRENHHIGEPMLTIDKLSLDGKFNDVSFSVRKGEIFGIAGLVGAGRTELIETIFGVNEKSSGTIYIDGKEVDIPSPSIAIEHGMALLTEDRRQTGLSLMLSVEDNGCIANIGNYINQFKLLDLVRLRKETREECQKIRVKTPSMSTPIGNLSGGNQQKVLLARWLLTQPDILFLDEPTRGIDVGAKAEIYKLVSQLAAQGKTVIMVSSEMPELLGLCDRIMVMHEGRAKGILSHEEASQETIMDIALN
ncbi:sugar ABC transporter ATP-binding protein [Endozoicomonas atrinae]|uniref:sugar ABC transporter ATP-binding protein n=1 Tax=Endozoicomonas atrinae TaxID=1333660 RepID=UPI0008248D08|nr:sugar ABC transporter ATP-binding protein [Endozoicomonas atrinae]